MRFRYTKNELLNKDSEEYMSDFELIRAILNERESDVTNVYSPLSLRIKSLKKKIENLADSKSNIGNL